tara:strand:+ start:104 stop:1030 length:927 start_codon:yes stop_codon:yes gene_type:complete
MGWVISTLTKRLDLFAKGNKNILIIGGFLITIILIFSSGLLGWSVEKLFFYDNKAIQTVGLITLILMLSSSIASRSLKDSCLSVINLIDINNGISRLEEAREKLSFIVGRDVANLERKEILRAVAESASENSVDGIFAPIFWMLVGIVCWKYSYNFPGPLTFALVFKASSTLDSMIGYKEGNLKWIGYSAAKLDDILTWIPCRLVLITLPLVSRSWHLAPVLIKNAWEDGSKDASPNSGLSEAIFAHCLKIRMGGVNVYKSKIIVKEIIGINGSEADKASIKKILRMIIRLQIFWVIVIIAIELLMKI